MVTLPMLWLPILISAVIVFIAGNILWMALPFWHAKDYGRIDNPKPILDGLASVASGQYILPWMDRKTTTAEQFAEMGKGPGAVMFVRNPSAFSFPRLIGLYFLYTVMIAIFVAYITSRTRPAGTEYLEVFRVSGTAAFLAYGLRGIPDSIWYGKPWKVTFKELIDGLIFGLLTGGVFGWLWPN